jgi:AcrR family transcriptional regulator
VPDNTLTIDIVSVVRECVLMSRIQERRREEKEMRRQSIIDAAEQVFAQRGFEVATMADIADQARLSRALVYFYFKDKEELALAITARGLQALRRSFERASAKCQTGLEKATAIGQAYMDFARNQSDYFKFFGRGEVRELGPSPVGENERLCASEGEKTLAVLADAVRRGVADGTIDPGVGDPAAVAVVLWGFIHGMLQVAASKKSMLEKLIHLDIADLLQGGLRLASRAIRAG